MLHKLSGLAETCFWITMGSRSWNKMSINEASLKKSLLFKWAWKHSLTKFLTSFSCRTILISFLASPEISLRYTKFVGYVNVQSFIAAATSLPQSSVASLMSEIFSWSIWRRNCLGKYLPEVKGVCIPSRIRLKTARIWRWLTEASASLNFF